jgi:hypothetical protein
MTHLMAGIAAYVIEPLKISAIRWDFWVNRNNPLLSFLYLLACLGIDIFIPK